ncbi:type II toxin-antitoxin system RelE/ParE family toxin [Archaeoglobales archaeon]|nr:MAG: type II toxin-antitoxin system RelE/ParE family toxin [Archaeoglobales archaeon]RLI80379.1 MAG: type II toxin-antitoxin system RelE/ParE family toxin [Archaeoglobales archaeon]
MPYKIIATPEFEKAFKDLTKKDKPLAEKLAKAIKKLSEIPYSGKPLSYEYSGCRSLHVGKYRIIYTIKEDKKEIWLIFVEHRDKLY